MPDYAQFITDRRRQQRRRVFLRFALFIVLPTVLAFLYATYYATPRYTAEFQLTYQTYQPPQVLSSGLVPSLFGSSQQGTDYIGAILYEYLLSPALLNRLDKELNLRAYYSRDKIDYPTRLSANASNDTLLDYYHWHVIDVSEGLGGYLTVDVQAFDPDYAVALARAMTRAADEMLEGMSSRAKEDEVRFAEDELKRQETRVLKARQAMTGFQNLHGDISPPTVAQQLGSIVGSIEGDLAIARAQRADLLTHFNANAPQLAQLQYKIDGLEKQLADQRARLATNSVDGKPYSKVLEEYSALQIEEQFAQSAYQAAQQGLVVARADAARKQSYLVDFAPAIHPDRPDKWFAATYTLTAFVASVCIYALLSLMIGAFRDQAGI